MVVLDRPGVYQLRVTVTLEQPDPITGQQPPAVSGTVELTAEGQPACFPAYCYDYAD